MARPRESDHCMSADAFIRWYDAQPPRPRYELLDGIVHEMQSERLIHAEIKARIAFAFRCQIGERRLPCQALGDGMAVRVDDATVFESDALVRCGPPLPDDTVLLTDPVIVVEVTSPSSRQVDVLTKFARYFRNPNIVHYLIVGATERIVIHHRRRQDGRIESTGFESGTLVLEPPGLALALDEVFDSAAPFDANER